MTVIDLDAARVERRERREVCVEGARRLRRLAEEAAQVGLVVGMTSDAFRHVRDAAEPVRYGPADLLECADPAVNAVGRSVAMILWAANRLDLEVTDG